MELKKEFEFLLKWGIENPEHKREVTKMASYLIACLNSTDQKELSKDELDKIFAGCASEWGVRVNFDKKI